MSNVDGMGRWHRLCVGLQHAVHVEHAQCAGAECLKRDEELSGCCVGSKGTCSD